MSLKSTRHPDIYIAVKELTEEHPDYPISCLCKLGHITRASCYKWKNRTDNENDVLNERIAKEIEKIHDEHPDMGYRRIRDTLEHDYDINVNDKRILLEFPQFYPHNSIFIGIIINNFQKMPKI